MHFLGALLFGFLGVEIFRAGTEILVKKRFVLSRYEAAFWNRARGKEWTRLKEKRMGKLRPWRIWGWLNRIGGVLIMLYAILILVLSFAELAS